MEDKMAKRNQEPSKKKLLKIPAEDYDKIQELADKFTAGNTSMWIKHAALNYYPKPEELN
jgi:hypothetical protein